MKQLHEIMRNTKIGIWGYGVVGKAAAAYLKTFTPQVSVFDHKNLPEEQRQQLHREQIHLYAPSELISFLEMHDYIIPSPGIDLTTYKQYAHKFVAEFDLFCNAWKKPIIAITGTVGKTSITHILSQLLSLQNKIATGGNIGTGMLSLLSQQNTANSVLLELSSFQLELCKSAAPDIAVVTNIYPNHIDRHGSLEQYRAAKYNIFAHQTPHQHALVPLELMPSVRVHCPHKLFHFFSPEQPTQQQLSALRDAETIFYMHERSIYCYHNMHHEQIALLPDTSLSYPENWLIIYAMLNILSIPTAVIARALPSLTIPDHRLACIAHHQGISFYNDSKATIPEATIAAVKKLQGVPLILFLGGVSKGVDRRSALAALGSAQIKHIVCFGKEAEQLQQACREYGIAATMHETLKDAFDYCMQYVAQSGDHILFSPSGASFDLFSHYQERGDVFKKLVAEYCKLDL